MYLTGYLVFMRSTIYVSSSRPLRRWSPRRLSSHSIFVELSTLIVLTVSFIVIVVDVFNSLVFFLNVKHDLCRKFAASVIAPLASMFFAVVIPLSLCCRLHCLSLLLHIW